MSQKGIKGNMMKEREKSKKVELMNREIRKREEPNSKNMKMNILRMK